MVDRTRLSRLRQALVAHQDALTGALSRALRASPLRDRVVESGAADWLRTEVPAHRDVTSLAEAAHAEAARWRQRGIGVEVLVEAARVWSRAVRESVGGAAVPPDTLTAADDVASAIVGAWAAAYARGADAPTPASASADAEAAGILQRVIDHIPYGIAIYSPHDLTLQQINRFGREFLAEPYHDAVAVGLPLDVLVPGAARTGLVDAFRRVAETREPLVIREAPLEGTEHTTYVNWIVLPVSDDAGRVIALVHVIDDVTEDVQSRGRLERFARETELRRAELEAVIASMADGVLIIDRSGYVLQANDAATQILGMDEETLRSRLAKPGAWRAWDAQGRRVRPAETVVARAIRTGEPVLDEELTLRDGRREVVVSVSAAPVRDSEGDVTGAVVVFRDITRQKQAQEEQVRRERLRAVGEMASGVAHDFNNLLSLVLGRTELLRDEVARGRSDPEAIAAALETVEQAAMDGAETVRRLQEFTRSQRAGTAGGSVDVNQVIRDAVALSRPRWRDAPQQEGRTIDCVLALDEGIPPAQGTASDLREVLINLLFNAVDAMPEGGSLTLRSAREGSRIQIAVSDTGTGMTREVKRRLFEPFFTTKGTAGGGMGLSMAYGIVARYGGQIQVESQRGKGSTFTVVLPAARGEPGDREREPAAPAAARILAVDDEPGVLQTLQLILNADGHSVTACSNGPEALDRAAAEAFDMVFTDLGMPEMSGWEVARRVKEIRPKTPVALVTGWGISLDQESLRDSGVDLVISKPFRMADLRQVVAEAMMLRDKM